MNLQESNAQLVIRKYNRHGTTFAHCLICSTAPINAESHYREDLTKEEPSYQIGDIKSVLRNFIREKWGEAGKDLMLRRSLKRFQRLPFQVRLLQSLDI